MRGQKLNPDDPHLLYRCFNASGDLLYVGMTSNLEHRVQLHRSHTPWFGEVTSVTRATYPNRPSARGAEHNAIIAERPRYNRWPLLPRSGKKTPGEAS